MDKFDLYDDYRTTYELVRQQAQRYDVPLRNYDKALKSLCEQLYQAQQNDEKPSTIVGDDIQEFAKAYFAKYAFRTYCKQYLNDIHLLGIITCFVAYFRYFTHHEQTDIQLFCLAGICYFILNTSSYIKDKMGHRYEKIVTTMAWLAVLFVLSVWSVSIIVPTIPLLLISSLWTIIVVARFVWKFNRLRRNS